MTQAAPDAPTRERITDPRIEAQLEHSRAHFGEEGIEVAAWVGDELIVNTWAGPAERDTGREIDQDTIMPVFSIGKALAATAVHLQAERGLVDYDAPVAEYWPEFAAHGKGDVLVKHVLTHRAGLPQMPDGVTPELMIDWEWMIHQLESMPLLWPANSRPSYLALTFGWLTGEVVRRTDPQKRPFGRFLQDEICGPLDIDSFFIGLPESERPRVATVYADQMVRAVDLGDNRAPYNALALPKAVLPGPAVFNRPDVQAACVPGANAVADARSAARLFSLLAGHGQANGVRLLSEDRVWSFCEKREGAYDPDQVIGRPSIVGVGGYFVAGEYPPCEPVVGPGPRTLCQPGAGSNIAWADLDQGFSAAIIHNRMWGNFPPRAPGDHPLWGIADAIRAVVADHC